jgi:hypothetical protein
MKKKIKKELPAVGTELFHFYYRKIIHTARIVKDSSSASGKALEFKGKKYESLSAASLAVTGKSTNGWIFWRPKTK